MKLRIAALFLAVAVVALGADKFSRVRRPIMADVFYPANPDTLQAAVDQYLTEVEPMTLPGLPVAVVLPHSAYKACGPVMAAGVKPLPWGYYKRVIFLAPALYAEFRGCSIPAVQYYESPLGIVELDGPAIRKLELNALFELRSVIYRPSAYSNAEVNRQPLHEREPAIEVALPFLQTHLGRFKLVPIIVGQFEKINGGIDEKAIDAAVRSLRDLVDDTTLVVVSSEFTRYGAVHNYTPFRKNVFEGIADLDLRAFELVQNRQFDGFESYLEETGNHISGRIPLLLMMKMLPQHARGVMLGYELSGRRTNNTNVSVSYGSIVFVDGTRAMPPDTRPVVEPKAESVPPSTGAPEPVVEDAAPVVPQEGEGNEPTP